ncbi:branched-chain amino acid ABC transporter substrate-binding protein [Ralstonia mannitolilytica]|uniref:Leucine-, isoleucine-, valine-, threonine-, and alanine-binding protein n=1 Tax=Ralstonia mannitolilytica TaxID=105219 RepID=A0AAD2EDY3_9RALS|nr:branched-chain amino acid ABC transporter substrate-binding protein [Ralstonia mannitolilytica]MBY4719477.1 branched-chain amino acid ABC transporter substrate-binding protein [Ralstonia mannitolilytica]CAJ0679372.1 Leucine-, isoleucine-, valine-, threonine-, and alanine-binding protein [Ralstonia mannitolilytica]CAJ0854414.1 Leucine-, isoleucine-, valine-, threonine-, and alanine-binding protein [Ralstonia mannitolilytica]
MTKFRPLVVAVACVAAIGGAAVPAAASAAETVKIAWIDPLSGLMGALGQNQLRSWQYIADMATQKNWAGDGTKFEVVGFDNKLSPQESLTVLKQVADQGIHYIVQGNGSSVGMALEDAVGKYNERNLGKEIIYLNYAAVDPDMTNGKCNYWHFRLDANSDMKMEALTSYLAKDPKVKKVYLINQNYSFGHQVARAAKEYLKRKRPDIEIVGEDLHPLAQVKDFSPYVAKIKSSGADTVITGNWGSDLALLIKAGKDAGLNANFYTYYASTTGVPTAMGSAGADHVKYVGYWNVNNNGFKGADIVEGYKKKYNDDFYLMASYTGIAMLAKAIKETKSAEPAKVAKAFEGMKVDSLNGTFEMRASDHQGQQPLYIATWKKVDGKDVKFDQENTGYGWKTDAVLDAYVASQPTSCQMKRPH